jgi:hypothetical protein
VIRPLLLLALAAASPLAAQEAPATPLPTYPFGVGERFQYQVKLGLFSVGRATMQVVGLDSVRGHETFIFRFTLNGKALFFSLDDTLTSWTGTADFHSYRFIQENNEDGKSRTREFEIYPDSAKFRYNGLDSLRPSVHDPLDDTGFFYWVRTLPLEVGQSYSWDRYFKLDRNPVRIRVLKRQNCELPGDRERKCLLIQPSIKSNGMLGESSDARILLTDDADRIPVEVRSNFSFGTLVLKLRQVRLASDTTVTWR